MPFSLFGLTYWGAQPVHLQTTISHVGRFNNTCFFLYNVHNKNNNKSNCSLYLFITIVIFWLTLCVSDPYLPQIFIISVNIAFIFVSILSRMNIYIWVDVLIHYAKVCLEIKWKIMHAYYLLQLRFIKFFPWHLLLLINTCSLLTKILTEFSPDR